MTRARYLRKSATDCERILWRHLRNRKFAAYKFRRQHPLDPYVLDFYCPALKLAIELDGSGTPALVFSGDDIFQLQQIIKQRRIVIGPINFIRSFRLNSPLAAELSRAHFAPSSFFVFLSPYVLTRHRWKTLH